MEKKYYNLKKGDIIKNGDEIKKASKWVKAVNTIGQKAPDPSFISHRKYRRLIKDD